MRFGREVRHVLEESLDASRDDRVGSFETMCRAKNTYHRAVLACSIVMKHVPDVFSDVMRKALDPKYAFDKWPFALRDFKEIEKIKKGYRSEIFLLDLKEEGQEAYVVKVCFRSAGSEIEDLMDDAKRYTKEYKNISDWYASIPGLVPWEASFISSDPRNQERAIFTVQRFLGGNVRGIFEDFTETELVIFLQENREVLDSLARFVAITREGVDQHGRIVDVAGECNLLLSSSQEKGVCLHFIDTHDVLIERGDRRFPRRLERLEYLERVLSQVE